MFCPKCATQNAEGASFCRSCGANISLIPQALSGQLARTGEETAIVANEEELCGKRGKRLTLDHAFKNIFMGVAFLIIAIVLSRTIGQVWWFWMLLPAFSLMGTGLAQFIRLRNHEQRSVAGTYANNNTFASRPTAQPLHAPPTEQLMPPVASVTEGTTRHLAKTPEHR